MTPMAPSTTLVMKLGSIVVHADEATEPGGHSFDIAAMCPLRRPALSGPNMRRNTRRKFRRGITWSPFRK